MDFLAESNLLPCFSKAYLGFDCPGCGLQRSALKLLQADFAGAFALYPPIYSLAALAVSVVVFAIKPNPITQKTAIGVGVAHALITIASYAMKFI